jgi:hypothetical protein
MSERSRRQQASPSYPLTSGQRGVRLKVDDYVLKRGVIYRIAEVAADYALAVPRVERKGIKAFLIRPPVTTAYIQVADIKSVKRGAQKRRQGTAISTGRTSQVKYADRRWSVFPMAGGRTESNRRRH